MPAPRAAAADATAAPDKAPFPVRAGGFAYLLDKARSDSMEPFLRHVGAPWIARKLANRSQPTLMLRYSPLGPPRQPVASSIASATARSTAAPAGGASAATANAKTTPPTQPAADKATAPPQLAVGPGADIAPYLTIVHKTRFRTTCNTYAIGRGLVSHTVRGDKRPGQARAEVDAATGDLQVTSVPADAEHHSVVRTTYSCEDARCQRIQERIRVFRDAGHLGEAEAEAVAMASSNRGGGGGGGGDDAVSPLVEVRRFFDRLPVVL